MNRRLLLFTINIFFLLVLSIKTFADSPLLRLTASYPGVVAGHVSHVVTLEDNLGLNGGNNIWVITGSKTGNYSFIFMVKVNGVTIYHGTQPFTMERVLNVGDNVELIFDVIPSISKTPLYDPSFAVLEINIY